MKSNTFRLFISSTFSDFLVEREVLNDDVYPAVRDYCKERGYDFQIVDLRWGVNSESTYRHNTLEICLNEVRRCKNLSPRPNFLLMLGERYGWVPLPSVIKASAFDKLASNCSEDEACFLKQWYLLDNNALEPEYCLRTREGKYIDDDEWDGVYNHLQEILIRPGMEDSIDSSTLLSFNYSATEREIIEGLFENNENAENSLAFLRNNNPSVDADITRISDLRNRIRRKLEEAGCPDRIIELEYGNNEAYRKEFASKICDSLLSNIEAEIDRLWEERSQTSIRSILEGELLPERFIAARMKTVGSLLQYAQSDINAPLYVLGEPGSGKTTVLAKMISEYYGDAFFSFYGLDDNSFELVSALSGIVEDIKSRYDIVKPILLTKLNVAESIYSIIYSIPKEEKALIVIDGLESFQDLYEIRENIVPRQLPENVKMIISSADMDTIKRFMSPKSYQLNIADIDEKDSRAALRELLSDRGRVINNVRQKEVIGNAIKGGCSPLRIKLIADIASKWKSYEAVEEIPSSEMELAGYYLESMFKKYGHERNLCLYAYALISSTPYGIMEGELQEILFSVEEVRTEFEKENKYQVRHKRLPFAVWSRLFYDISDCAGLHMSGGMIVVRFKHRVFSEAISGHYSEICSKATEKIIDFYIDQPSYSDDYGLPNSRKAQMLPYLMRLTENRQGLMALYRDIQFVDSLIKIGSLDTAISDLGLCYEQGLLSEEDVLKRELDCLHDNYELLSCYRNCLEQCLIEADLTQFSDWTMPVQREIKVDYTKTYFRYSKNSKISINDSKSRVAVYYGSYLYVCRYPDFMEECREFIFSSDSSGAIEIKDVKWSNEESLFVVTEKEIYLYSYRGRQLRQMRMWSHSGINVEVDSETSTLIFINEGDLLIYNYARDELLRKISKAIIFHINADERVLDILLSHHKIVRCDLSGDRIGGSKRLRIKRSTGLSLNKATRMLRTKGGKYIFWNENSGAIIQYDPSEGGLRYENLPLSTLFLDPLIGNSYIAYCTPSIIYLIEIRDKLYLKYYEISDAYACFWEEKDDSLIVVCNDGIRNVRVAEFTELPPDTSELFAGKYNYSISEPAIYSYFARMLRIAYIGRRFSHYNDYDVLFFDDKPGQSRASLLVYADDGKYMIAYESKSAICVFNSNGEELIRLDHLNLSVVNNILKLCFSNDSNKILIWRTYSIQVVDIAKARCICNIDVHERPAYDVSFSGDSDELYIFLCNEENYRYSLSKKTWIGTKLPKYAETKNPYYQDNCFGIYKVVKDEWGEYVPFRHYFGVLDENSPSQWFGNDGAYGNNHISLFMGDGFFYVNNNAARMIDNTYMDFNEGRQIERLKDDTIIDSFLREKNDIMSDLYDIGNDRVVLVCRALRSVISFDVSNLEVLTIHKLHADIIGNRLTGGKLEVYCNQVPYRTVFKIKE